MSQIHEYVAVHLLAEKKKLDEDPRFRVELGKSVLVQGAEQRTQAAPGFSVGVLVYLRQENHVIPERLDAIVYVACIQEAVERIIQQCLSLRVQE